MHLLLEQHFENSKWHSANSLGIFGTVSDSGAFSTSEVQTVASSLTADSVVVLFLFPNAANNDANSIAAIIDCCIKLGNGLKVWCHYGGDVAFQELPDRWADYDRFPVLGNANPKQALEDFYTSRDVKYPYPFSSNYDLPWRHQIDSARTTMKVKQWPDVKSQLDDGWELAEKEISKFKTMREVCQATRWYVVVNEIKACLKKIPADNCTIDHWRQLCELAHDIGVEGEAPSHQGKSLEDKYQAIRGTLCNLCAAVKNANSMDDIRTNLEGTRNQGTWHLLQDAISGPTGFEELFSMRVKAAQRLE
jgi:hypothetical protein